MIGGATVLEVEGLRVEVEGRGDDIVDDISFTIGAGEVLGLVGESGSGKSTVGVAILGHTRRGAKIVHGAVRIEGKDMLSLPLPIKLSTACFQPSTEPPGVGLSQRLLPRSSSLRAGEGRSLAA